MPERESTQKQVTANPMGPARDFSNFIELEFERRRSSQKDFDAALFEQAVALVLDKLKS